MTSNLIAAETRLKWFLILNKVAISFHYQYSEYRLRNTGLLKVWLDSTIKQQGKSTGKISFFILNDNEMRGINREFLEHDYFTDVITFDYSEENKINGEVYISYDTVKFNSQKLGVSWNKEMRRVILHGVLHLLGFNDKKDSEIEEMRKMEEKYLGEYGNKF